MFTEVAVDIDNTITCITVNNGADALQKLQSMQVLPDLVFLDLNMPKLNGKQCLQQIKQIERLNAIPIIMYTTSTLPEDAEVTKELGAAYFLIKPSSMNELKEKLQMLFSKEWIAQAKKPAIAAQ
jgi:CheY-like chemotaxis protein